MKTRVATNWKERLEESEDYQNWMKVSYGIHLLCTGIRPYIEREAKAFHRSLLIKPMAPCTCVHVPSRRPNPYHDMTVCDWAKELKRHHVKRNPTWSQSDGSKWTDPNVGYWEVAKLYMPFGCASGKVSAEETDPTGLLNLLQFCDHFKTNRTNVDALKTTRNEWAHAEHQELTDYQTNDAFVRMKNLLNDAELLSDPDANDALVNIIDLEMQNLVEREDIDSIKLLVEDGLKEFMETIHEGLDSLRIQEDTHAIEIIDKICEVEKIVKKEHFENHKFIDDIWTSLWTNYCWCVNTVIQCSLSGRVKGLPIRLMVIVFLLSGISLLDDDVQDIGCISNDFDHLELKQFDFTERLNSWRQDFIGRQWMFQNLTDTLRDDNNTENGFLMIAAPGFGKTSLIANMICTRLSSHEINTQILGYHFCSSSDRNTINGGKFVQNLANMIAFKILAYRDLLKKDSFLQRMLKIECYSDPSGCFEQGILTPLKRLSREHNVFRQMYIVIDALDECDNEETNKDASIINMLSKKSRSFPKWLKVIATTRNFSSVRRKLRNFIQMDLLQEDPRNLRDIEAFLNRKFLGFHDNATISKMVNQSQGNFLYITRVLAHSMDNWFDTNIWKTLPATIESVYQDFFERKFDSVQSFYASRNICEILVSTLQPLTADEVYDILHFENKDFHYEYDFMTILDKFSDFLRYSGDKKHLHFFHNSLQEWLTSNANKGGNFFVDQVNGNRLLAHYFLQKFQETSVPITAHFVYNLAKHIVRGGEEKHLLQRFSIIDQKLITVADTITNTTALHLAAEDKNGRVLQLLLRIFKSVDILDGQGRSPVFYAVQSGLLNNIRMLHNGGASLQFVQSKSVLHDEYSSKNFQMRGDNLLHLATRKGYLEIVKYFVKNNYGIKDECRSCEISGKPKEPHQISCNTALHIAVLEGYNEIVEILLKANTNALTCVNMFGREPLHEAIKNNNYQVSKMILESGGNPSSYCRQPFDSSHMPEETMREMFSCGFSSLHIAAYYGFPAITELLLQYKANFDAVDCNDMKPIHIAACRGQGEALKKLVENGADINSKNSKGMTAAHYACKCKAGNLFEILAGLGADGRMVTEEKKSPLHFIIPESKIENQSLYNFNDAYVQSPIEPIDFKTIYNVKTKDNEWYTLWTKFLTAFQMTKHFDALLNISSHLRMELFTDFISAQIHQIVFGSAWLSYEPFTSLIAASEVNKNIDLGFASNRHEVYDNTGYKIILKKSFTKENSTACALLMSFMKYPLLYTTDVLLSLGTNVNCRSSGETPMLMYLKAGWPHMAKVLVKHGVTIDIKCNETFDDSIFHLSAYHKLHYLQYLTIFQDSDEWEKYLQTKDALFDYLFDEYENLTKEGKSRIERVRDGPVAKAIKSHPKGFKIIDECVDAEGYTALHRAAQGGNVVAVKYFLDWGADVRIQIPNFEFDPLVITIWYAIKYRPHFNFHKSSILTSLEIDFASLTANIIFDYMTKKKPFDVGCSNQRETPTILHLAATRGMWRFIKKLFEARDQSKVVDLDANCRTKQGITPMYLAKVYGGGNCQKSNNPWCKVVDVLIFYGGSEKMMPDIATEYFIILNFVFNHLPGQLELGLNAEETAALQDSTPFGENGCSTNWIDNEWEFPPDAEKLVLSTNNITKPVKKLLISTISVEKAEKKYNQLYTQYHMFLTFITGTITSGFSNFNTLDGTLYKCVISKVKSVLTDKSKTQTSNAEKESVKSQEDNFHLPQEENIIYPFLPHMFVENFDLCSPEHLHSFETTLDLNHHNFLSRYQKYKNQIVQTEKEYSNYLEIENLKNIQFESELRKYKKRAKCYFTTATHDYAKLKLVLHTMRFWQQQVSQMRRALPSISPYVFKKIQKLIMNNNRNKLANLITQLTKDNSVNDHEYLRMLRFSKAPMFDKTIDN